MTDVGVDHDRAAPEREGVRFKAFRPSLWRSLLTMASPNDLAVILFMALRRDQSRFVTPQIVHPRPLGSQPIHLRPKTSDARVMLDVLVGRFHLPPKDLPEPKVVWDLGTNIGLTVAHYATLFPAARVTGVEPDEEMAEMARLNLTAWGDRCSVVTGAVWSSDRDLHFSIDNGEEFGAHVREGGSDAAGVVVRGLSLNTLLADEEVVDYLKVDIEGAEGEILSNNTDWAEKVRCISVEIHPPHTVASITASLNNLGFVVEKNQKHWAAVVARRP